MSALLTLEEARRYGAPPVLAARSGALVKRVRTLLNPATPRNKPRAALTACMVACVGFVTTGAFVLQPVVQETVTQFAATIRYTVSASDPAGDFTLSIERGVAVGATIAHAPVPAHRIRQAGDSVFILNDSGARELALRVAATGGITWSPRSPQSL